MSDNVCPFPTKLEAILCPICDEVTLPNATGDGHVVCSCPSHYRLPMEALKLSASTLTKGDIEKE